MNGQELVNFLQEQIKLNPFVASDPIESSQGGEIDGISFGTNGVALSTNFRPKVEQESSWNYFEAMFKLAGIKVENHWELSNQYWPDAYMRIRAENPWWLVKTSFDLIEIGWRKRVISISWQKVEAVVSTDDVTKSSNLIHAHTVEKAVEYLKALKSAASK